MKKSILLGLIVLLVLFMVGCGSSGGSSTVKYTLTIDREGQGIVTPASGQKYSKDTVVTLTATPDKGWIFDRWDGPDAKQVSSNKIIMTKDMHIKAVFREEKKVATPVIGPGEATYYFPQKVTITCNTTGAVIFYTTDGSTPDQTRGTKYSAPFNVKTTTTIKAIAFRDGFNSSDVAAKTLTIPRTRIVFQSDRDGNSEIYSMDLIESTQRVRLTNNSAWDGSPALSPDGSKVVFSSGRDGITEIYLMAADGSNQVRLTNNSAPDNSPVWSPDGSKIAFTSLRDGNWEIYLMDTDGSNQVRLTNNSATEEYPTWSPDGSKIAFISNRDGNFEIYVMDADGSNQLKLTNSASEYDPAWSPDGSKIVFQSKRNGNYEIYVMDTDGNNEVRLTNNLVTDGSPSWSPDGSKIVFDSNRDGNFEIYLMNTDGSNLVRLTNNNDSEICPDWAEVLPVI